ncbi:hypothetical protein HF1_10310 [Mycoplasma haemofelis str. Langford 1]|uniref:Uncharacterized protein n=1 Tax=Mycoplasma haemofelis (strain Langford 1) TaxID=941640 RepID=E8ZIR8_MYCHL|nr:hypothetical protein [Mycoplasma haemofelis]CBY93039.1 hypothetical protein HF1_10310 [Mycoplasma haemofelis str. Langford 1]
MSHTLAKIAALSGGTAAAGGGIAVGSSALSGTSGSKQEKVATSSEKQEDSNIEVIPVTKQEEATPDSAKKVCNVYTAEEPTSKGQPKVRVFTKIKEEFWSKGDFLKKIKEDRAWNEGDLKTQVEKGCQDHGSVYVWWGYGNPQSKGKTWVYASDMNNGKDWLNDESVSVPAALKPKVATVQ